MVYTTPMRTTIPTREIQPGDKLLAVDGHELRHGITVNQVIEATNVSVHVHVKQDNAITSPDRYLMHAQVTVERAEKPKRKATRTFHGIKFIKQDDGSWMTEDGKWVVAYVDDFETECDHEHPMKVTQADRDAYYALNEWQRAHSPQFPYYLRNAIETGAKGYLCPGDDTHFYGLWVAGSMDRNADEVVNREDTFTASANHLALYIQGKAESRA